MKTKITTALILTATLLFGGTEARAERGVDGLLLGAGSGALIGQAIGRDTEATLLGTAVGGVLGYIIGNEMDKEGYPTYAPAPVQYRPVYREGEYYGKRHGKRIRPEHAKHRYYAAPVEQCREAEVLGTIHGRPEKLLTTVCLDEYGRWVMPNEGKQVVVEKITIYKGKNVPPGHRGKVSGPYRLTNWR